MKIAFVIDKHQTFQIIAPVLKEALRRGHSCVLYSCFRPTIEEVNYFKIHEGFDCFFNENKNEIISLISKEAKQFDAVLGINIYNRGWNSLYGNGHKHVYSLEYCWNEIYATTDVLSKKRGRSTSASNDNFSTNSILFCNSQKSLELIESSSKTKDNIMFLGSPWYECLSDLKTKIKKKDRIVFMAPHNSLYQFSPGLSKRCNSLLKNLREYCDKNQKELVLKDRKKYKNSYSKVIRWDLIVSDTNTFGHIETYGSSDLVINFCSSGISELSFLETPYICVSPDIQKHLHTKIHMSFYSEGCFDKVHNDRILFDEMEDTSLLFSKIENLLATEKDWPSFQNSLFPGKHRGATTRVLDFIEKNR